MIRVFFSFQTLMIFNIQFNRSSMRIFFSVSLSLQNSVWNFLYLKNSLHCDFIFVHYLFFYYLFVCLFVIVNFWILCSSIGSIKMQWAVQSVIFIIISLIYQNVQIYRKIQIMHWLLHHIICIVFYRKIIHIQNVYLFSVSVSIYTNVVEYFFLWYSLFSGKKRWYRFE